MSANQSQRLRNTQPGGGQQRDQRGACLSSGRATRTESTGGFEKATDFVRRQWMACAVFR